MSGHNLPQFIHGIIYLMSDSEIDYEKYDLKRYQYWTVYLHYNQAYLGRNYIALNRKGSIDAFSGTTSEERAELEIIISKLQSVLNDLYQPDIYNYATFGNTWLRCHWHLIPRYKAPRSLQGQDFVDNNWGKNYAPYDHSFQISDELFNKIRQDMTVGLNS